MENRLPKKPAITLLDKLLHCRGMNVVDESSGDRLVDNGLVSDRPNLITHENIPRHASLIYNVKL